MWPIIDSPPQAVQFIFLVTAGLMGLSHMVRPAMWVDFFTHLHAQGHRGVLLRIFMLELSPAMLVVTLHQVWQGPALVLTLYGWAQLIKIAIGLLFPEIGLKGLAMAQRGNRTFVGAGVALIALAGVAGAALFTG